MATRNNPEPPEIEPQKAAASGRELVRQLGCRGCHVIGDSGGTVGPSLNDLFQRRDEPWIRAQIRDSHSHDPKTLMPDFGLTVRQVDAIVRYLHETP